MLHSEPQLSVGNMLGGTDLQWTTTQTRSFTQPPTLERRAPQTTAHPDPQVTQLSDVLLPTHVGIPVTTTTQTLYTLPS